MKEPVKNQEVAVSEVIGTVLLISLVVLASAIITVAIFSEPQAQKIPSLSALISNQSQTVYIKHVGGDALQNGTYEILVDGSDVTSGIAIPALWSIGNTLTYTKPGITPPVIVQVVYTGAGSPDVIAVSYFGILPAGGSIFMITASAGTGGTITPSGSVPVSFGANQTFVITNNTGYSIGNVVVDGTTSVGAVSSYTFSNVQVSHTISATFVAAPTISSISPTSGPIAGGTSVAITGTSFTGATAVIFGSSQATTFTVNNATSLNATSPAGSAGTVNITVTTPGGTSATSSADQFAYAAAPTISSISPTSGSIAGGTSVAITGTSFTGATAVIFGNSQATTFTVNNATSLNATSPAGSAGTVNITVTTPGGSATISYTYIVPTITGISPASGPTTGGTLVNITGTNLAGATSVTFGGTAATINSVTNTLINATTPPGSTGAVNVSVVTPNGTGTEAKAYTYGVVPTVASISPIAGPLTGSQSVTITGANFNGTISVYFGGNLAPGFTVINSTSIIATTPPGTAGPVSVWVITPYGSQFLINAYTYESAPTVTGVSPAAGLPAGGTSVTINGTNFIGASAVTFGTTAVTTFTVNTLGTQITVNSPSGTGTIDITVTTPSGTSATSSVDRYIYTTPITAVTITGTAQVGSTLTVGALTPAGAIATYQWEYSATSGGPYTNISGATASTLSVTSGYVSDYIEVAATGSGGYSGTVTSTAVGPVSAEPLTAIGAITGTAQVGSILTAGSISPSGATVTYQWEYSTTSGGTYTAILGATSSTYLIGSYAGDYIEVAATGSGTYSGTVTSAPVGPVSTQSLTGIGAIAGTTQVGSTLTAGSISPSGATVTYQWEYSTTSGGTYTAILGATSSTYTMASAYVNDYIKVAATGSGGYTGTVTSTAVGPVSAEPITAIGAITGTAQVGSTLTAGALTPSSATATYQWEYSTTSSGTYKSISGATSSTYTVASSYAKDYLEVVATGSSGYTGTVTSTAVGPVTTPLTAIGAITGTVQVGSKLTAGALTPSGATATYQWEYSTTSGGTYTAISGATSSTYTVASSYANDYLAVVATGSGSYSGTVTSAAVGPVSAEPLTAIGAITGTAAVGDTLTAGALTPSGATATYQWEYSTTSGGTYTAISGATSSTYIIALTYDGDYIKVAATGSGGYTGTVTSAATAKVT